jgi:hypothetical protein
LKRSGSVALATWPSRPRLKGRADHSKSLRFPATSSWFYSPVFKDPEPLLHLTPHFQPPLPFLLFLAALPFLAPCSLHPADDRLPSAPLDSPAPHPSSRFRGRASYRACQLRVKLFRADLRRCRSLLLLSAPQRSRHGLGTKKLRGLRGRLS